MRALDAADGDARPLFLCYEPKDNRSLCGMLVSVAGSRSLAGVHQHPQLAFWHQLDPEHDDEQAYNRYAHVELEPCPACLTFVAPGDEYWQGEGLPPNMFVLEAAPDHERLLALGARYAIAVGGLQDDPVFRRFSAIHRASDGSFTVFAIAPTAPSEVR